MSMWLEGLNPEQRLAVSHNDGPLLILAGAGSGKTTVLISRVGRLIHEGICKPEEITVLTFTNKAARELKHRVQQRLGRVARKIWAGTFHALGLEIIKQHHDKVNLPTQFTILDGTDTQTILKEIMTEIAVPGKEAFAVDKLLNIINTWRANPKKNVPGDEDYLALAEVLLPRLEKKLDLLGAVDFEGLLLKPIRLFKQYPDVLEKMQPRMKQLMVDEFQDTNSLQMEFIDLLAQPLCNLTVVGDDDQSIYGWRGAEIKNILQFPQKYKNCQVVKLERNYRSTPAILAVANELISHNTDRHGKILKSEKNEHGLLPEIFNCPTDEEECDWVVQQIKYFEQQGFKHCDIAILFRSNSQGALLEGTLRRHQIKYKLTGSNTLFDRKEVKEGLAFLRSAISPTDFSFKRILNIPPRGLGDSVLEKLHEASIKYQKPFWHNDTLLFSELNQKNLEVIQNFNSQLQLFKDKLIKSSDSPGKVLQEFLINIGYKEYILKSSKNKEGGDKKWILIEILGRILDSFAENGDRDYKMFSDFLDAMELRDFQNEKDHDDEVQLLTMHASKGLEYPVVLIVGVEEDIIPHRILGTDIHEERRLFYVALTRAKTNLLISRCMQRQKYGRLQNVSASRFLYEISDHLITKYEDMYRPVSGESRQSLVNDFMEKLKNKKATI